MVKYTHNNVNSTMLTIFVYAIDKFLDIVIRKIYILCISRVNEKHVFCGAYKQSRSSLELRSYSGE